MKSIFIFPPIWSNKSPSTGISSLCGFLEKHGYKTEIMDLNIEFFNSYISDKNYNNAFEYMLNLCAKEKYSETEKEIINIFQKNQKIYNSIKNKIDLSKKIVSSNDFYKKNKYKVANFIINKACELISLKNFPFIIYNDRLNNLKRKLEYVDYKKEALNTQHIFYNFIKEKAEEIAKKNPDIVGISINIEDQMLSGLTLAYILKNEYNIKISLGGTNISRLIQNIIEDKELFDLFTNFVLIGAGEIPIFKLFQAIEEKLEFKYVPSLIYKTNNEIIINEIWDGILTEEYNQNYDFTQINNYFLPEKVYQINISKGCYWGKCKFCDFNLDYSKKDVESVIKEIKELQKKYGAKYFYFTDSALSPKDALKFAKLVIKEKLKIRYTTFLRFEEIYDKNFLKLLYKSGLRCISWGLESANQRVLDSMNKGTKISTIKQILKDSAKIGIANRLTIIYLFPGEKYSEFCETIDFLKENYKYIFYVTFHKYVLKRYSYIFEHKEEFGINLTTKEIKQEYSYEELGLSYNQNDYNKKLEEITALDGGIYKTPDETLLYISYYENKYKNFIYKIKNFLWRQNND